MIDTITLGAKSLLAVMFLVAGGAKLADLTSFAAAVRLFLPHRIALHQLRAIAGTAASSELVIGAASLSRPTTKWVNGIVFAAACVFVVISILGYVFNRGRSCRCFGALSKREFNTAGILRSLAIGAVAFASMRSVRPSFVDISLAGSLLLLFVGVLLALAAFTAAQSLSLGIRYGLVKR